MKHRTHPNRPFHSIAIAVAAVLGLAHSASALTVPVAQDTYSSPTGKIAVASGAAPTLPVNSRQTALLRFDLSNLDALPGAIQPGNIQSARLRLYVVSAKTTGDVQVRTVETDWQEKFVGAPVIPPSLTAGSVITIPKAELIAKKFIHVDVTAAIVAALQSGNDFGFALQTTDPKAKLLFASKEGAATGYAAELEIIANTATDGDGNLVAGNGAFSGMLTAGSVSTSGLTSGSGSFNGNVTAFNAILSGQLNVSSAFVVEQRTASTGAHNTFIGATAGQDNTIGQLNVFVGTGAGANSINSSQNSFFGVDSGFNQSSGLGNSFFGYQCGSGATTGSYNTCMGFASGTTLGANSFNVFLGYNAGFGNTGSSNVYVGASAGSMGSAGTENVFVGTSAGASSSSGGLNVFVGNSAGQITTASENVFIGHSAGKGNTTGTHNVYVGTSAGLNTVASDNAMLGWNAGKTNTVGGQNSFFGSNAGKLSTASFNSYFGAGSGENNSTGSRNSFYGNQSGPSNTTGSNNTFVGDLSGVSNTVENNNTFVGQGANGAAGITNATAIGQGATVTISNAVVLGKNCSVGIGTNAPNSTLQVNGSLSLPIRTNTSLLAALDESDCVLINNANNAGVVLPTAIGITGRVYIIKNRAATALTIGTTPATQTIDGATTLSVATNVTVKLISHGGGWFRID